MAAFSRSSKCAEKLYNSNSNNNNNYFDAVKSQFWRNRLTQWRSQLLFAANIYMTGSNRLIQMGRLRSFAKVLFFFGASLFCATTSRFAFSIWCLTSATNRIARFVLLSGKPQTRLAATKSQREIIVANLHFSAQNASALHLICVTFFLVANIAPIWRQKKKETPRKLRRIVVGDISRVRTLCGPVNWMRSFAGVSSSEGRNEPPDE